MSDATKQSHTAGPLRVTLARTLLHIANEWPVATISISANHIREDYPGCKRDFVARQKAIAARIVLTWNSHDELVKTIQNDAATLREAAKLLQQQGFENMAIAMRVQAAIGTQILAVAEGK